MPVPSGFDHCVRNKINSTRSIAAHPCKKRKDGAPSAGMVQAKIVKGGPPAALSVGEVGALSDLDNITVRIADVAAYLAVLGNWFRDELRSSTFP